MADPKSTTEAPAKGASAKADAAPAEPAVTIKEPPAWNPSAPRLFSPSEAGKKSHSLIKVKLVAPSHAHLFDPDMRTTDAQGNPATGGYRLMGPGEVGYFPEASYLAAPAMGQLAVKDESGEETFADVRSQPGHPWRVFDQDAKEILGVSSKLATASRSDVPTAPGTGNLKADTLPPAS